MKHKLIVFGLAALSAVSSWAVPARRDVIHSLVQPDGSVIELTLRGDEHRHFYMTTDLVPVIADASGRWCYATVDPSGQLTPAGVQAHSPEQRSAAETAFVAALDREAVARAINASPRSRVHRANQSTGVGLFDQRFPHTGSPKAIVILVEYQDKKFTVTNPNQYYKDFLNKEGFAQHGGTGSVRDFYVKSSNGKFTPQFDVYGPVTLANNMSYYGGNDAAGNDKAPEKMVTEACTALDPTVNFADYDTDHNGYVDNIYVIYAGQGEASYGSTNTVWPHSWTLLEAMGTCPVYDGVKVNDYGCSNEWESTQPDGIGTFTHEFGHVMGLPDLYDTEYGAAVAKTPGPWSVMDYGSYNNNGRTPPASGIYERNAFGWIDPIVLDGATSVSLGNIHDTNQGAIILTSSPNEFFLLENRQQVGWDKYLPGHGMLIWHIDYKKSVFDANEVNNTSSHQYVDIEEAGGSANNEVQSVLASYPFPGTKGVKSFTTDTKPALRTWANTAINLPITDITEGLGIITFNVDGGTPIELTAPVLDKSPVVAGNKVTLTWSAVENATSYKVTLTTPDADGNPVAALDPVTTDNTTLTISRLRANTEYTAQVTALRGSNASPASAPVTFTTGDAPFSEQTATATGATNVTTNSFTANWQSLNGATDYLLSVNTLTEAAGTTDKVDFGTGSTLKLPTGWTTNSTTYYKSEGYYGAASPSIKLAKDGQYILSPVYSTDVHSLKFWTRGASGGSAIANSLTVIAYDTNGNSTECAKFEDIPDEVGGMTIEVGDDKIPAGTRQIRILFNKTLANVAIDDLELTTGGLQITPLEGYAYRSIGNNLSASVTGIPAGVTTCTYTVTAVNAEGVKSIESAPVTVTLGAMGTADIALSTATVTSTAGMIVVDTDADTAVCVADITGRIVSFTNGTSAIAVAPGMYIVTAGSTTCKIIVK